LNPWRLWFGLLVLLCLTLAAAQDPQPPETPADLVHQARRVIHTDLATAEQLVRRALTADPNLAEAHFVLGRIRERQGKPAEAEREFLLAEQLKKGYAEPTIARGWLLLRRQPPELDGARRAFEDASRVDSHNADAVYGLAQIALSSGDASAARDHLQRVLALAPNHYAARLDLGMELQAAGEYGPAKLHLLKAAELNPSDALPWFALGLVYDGLQQPEEALRAYDRALAIAPNDTSALYNKAVLLESMGREADALALYERIQSLGSGASDATKRAAKILETMGRDTQLIAKLRQILAANPADTESRLRLAKAYASQGKLREAQSQFEHVLATDPAHLQALRALAMMAEERQDPLAAERYYRAMVEAEPDAMAHRVSLARALLQQGRSGEALALARDMASARPNDVDALRFLVQMLSTAGLHDEAIQQARDLLRVAPNDAPTLAFVGSALERQGLLGEAAAYYRRAIDQAPSDGGLRLSLARVLEGAKQTEPALAQYRAARECLPHSPQALDGVLRCLETLGDVAGIATELEGESGEQPADYALAMRAAAALIDARQLAGARTAALRALDAASSNDEADAAIDMLTRLGARQAAAEGLARRYSQQPSAALALRIAGVLGPGVPAQRWCREALGLVRGDPGALADAVSALADAGDLEGAALTGVELMGVHARSPALSAAVGRVYEKIGDRKTAAFYYRRALKFEPDCAEALAGLERCGG